MLNRAFRTALCTGALLRRLGLPAHGPRRDFPSWPMGRRLSLYRRCPRWGVDGCPFPAHGGDLTLLGFAQGISPDAATAACHRGHDGAPITLTIDQRSLPDPCEERRQR